MTKPEMAIALYALYDRLWVKSDGVITKEESRALMEAAQFFQNEANVVAVVEPKREYPSTDPATAYAQISCPSALCGLLGCTRRDSHAHTVVVDR